MQVRSALITLIGLCVFACASSALSQEVRMTKASAASLRKAAEAAAEEQGIALFPRISDGMPGTQVHFTFNPRKANILLTSTSSAEVLLEEAKGVAERLGLTKADFAWRQGSLAGAVWIDLFDYLVIAESRTSFEMRLDQLLAALEKSGLERPVMLCVHAQYGQEARLLTEGLERTIAGMVFFDVAPDQPSMTLQYVEELRWYAVLTMLFFAILLILPIAMPLFLVRTLRKRTEEVKIGALPKESRWGNFLFAGALAVAVLVLPPVLKSSPAEHAMSQAMSLLPFEFSFAYILPAALVVFGIMATTMMISMRKMRAESTLDSPQEVLPQDHDEGDPIRLMGWVMLVPLLLLFGGGTLMFWTDIPRVFTPFVLFAPAALAVIGGVALFSSRHFSRRSILDPGHPAARAARELSTQTGVTVKRMYTFRTSDAGLNYWPNGTMTITTRVLSDFSIDEIRALIAVEFARAKLSDPAWKSGLTIAIVIALFSLLFFLPNMLGINMDHFSAALPLAVLVAGAAWARFRGVPDAERRQAKIDALALQLTHNREALVSALMKQGHVLLPSHEMPAVEATAYAPEGLRKRIQSILVD